MKHEECLTCCQFNEKRCHCTHTTGREYKRKEKQVDGVSDSRDHEPTAFNVFIVSTAKRSEFFEWLSRSQCFVCDVFLLFYIDFRLCISPHQLSFSAHRHFSAHLFLNKIIHCCSFDCIEQLPGNVETRD